MLQINDIAFEKFRTGQFRFQPTHRQEIAQSLIQLSNLQLIEAMYEDNLFESEIVKRELIHRKIMDDDIYKIGFYGNDIAKTQAIDLMKYKVL
ncbi:hypothetical protein [Rubinisphaera italica]|nr:hypothetical protein [Rubinisphaera italica]